jgi:hypothetical protein
MWKCQKCGSLALVYEYHTTANIPGYQDEKGVPNGRGPEFDDAESDDFQNRVIYLKCEKCNNEWQQIVNEGCPVDFDWVEDPE